MERAKLPQSCPTLCGPVDCSRPGSPLSMEFFRQEYCSQLPCPPPGELPDPDGTHLSCLLQLLAGSLPLGPPGKEAL